MLKFLTSVGSGLPALRLLVLGDGPRHDCVRYVRSNRSGLSKPPTQDRILPDYPYCCEGDTETRISRWKHTDTSTWSSSSCWWWGEGRGRTRCSWWGGEESCDLLLVLALPHSCHHTADSSGFLPLLSTLPVIESDHNDIWNTAGIFIKPMSVI